MKPEHLIAYRAAAAEAALDAALAYRAADDAEAAAADSATVSDAAYDAFLIVNDAYLDARAMKSK